MKPLGLQYVSDLLSEDGYTLLSSEYKDNVTPLDFICPTGHKGSMTVCGWLIGNRCAKCAGNAKMTIEEVSISFEKENYTLISKEYFNAHTKLEYICPNNHKHSITWSNWNNKKKFRCPKCSNRVSKQEIEIHNILKTLDITFISSCRSVLVNPNTNRPLELDIWLPTLNKAIEFNGDYWHKDEVRINLDNIKKVLCEKQNITLMVITYTEWLNDPTCITRLKAFVTTG